MDSVEKVVLTEKDVSDFLAFLGEKSEYLETGLGAFHTDDHSNW